MSEQPVPEPGGWLVELQRARLRGGAAMTTFQGLLVDEIVIAQSAADARDPALMVRAVCDFAEAMLERGFYIAGEFAPEAVTSFYVQDYLRQALQGGHTQYIANRGGDEIAVKCANAALKSMLADPHHDIFARMIRLNSATPRDRRKLLKQMRARSVDAAMHDLDAKLAALEAREPLAVRHKLWLKSLRKLKLTPDAELASAIEDVLARNPLRARRAAEAQRDRAALVAGDPLWRAAKELCDMAALRFERLGLGGRAPMRTIWAEGPNVRAFVWPVTTLEGPRTAVFYAEGGWFKRYLAVLMEEGVMLPRGSLSLSKDQFAAIVPAPLRRT